MVQRQLRRTLFRCGKWAITQDAVYTARGTYRLKPIEATRLTQPALWPCLGAFLATAAVIYQFERYLYGIEIALLLGSTSLSVLVAYLIGALALRSRTVSETVAIGYYPDLRRMRASIDDALRALDQDHSTPR